MSDDDSGTLSINLPPITAQSRSISGERIETLKNLTAKYRVTVNSMTREGTEVSYTFSLPVGIVAKITVECLNSSGEVIVRAYKEHKVTGGDNSVFISLKNDGNEIINTGLYYSYGDAAAGGAVSGLPAGRKLEVGGKFTVDDGSAMTWEHAEDPTGSGSGFTGWRTNVALTGDTDTQTPDVQAGGGVLLGGTYIMPDGNVTLSAQWNKKQYSLSFDYNIPASASQSASGNGKPDNTSPQDAFSQVTVGSETPTLNAQGQQWTFKYWTLTQADTGTQYRAFQQVTLTGNITLYAQWTNESVWRVTFDEPATKPTAYTSAMPQGNVVKQGEPFSWTNPAARGWTFGGWEVNDGISTPTTLTTNTTRVTPNSDITLMAQWTPIPYTVKFNSAGGSAVSDINNFTVNGSDSFAANPTYTGYTFGGWQYNSTPIADAAALRTAITNGSVTATGNNEITLTAVWTAITYSISYDINGGTFVPGSNGITPSGLVNTEFKITSASVTLNASTNFAKQGYTFANWETSSGQNVSNMSASQLIALMGSGSTTLALRAKWNEMTTLYVNSTGNDTTGDGSQAKPLATLNKAFTLINAMTGTTKEIKLASNISVNDTVTLDSEGKDVTLTSDNGTVRTVSLGLSLNKNVISILNGNLTMTNITLDGQKGNGILITNNSSVIDVTGKSKLTLDNTTIQNFKLEYASLFGFIEVTGAESSLVMQNQSKIQNNHFDMNGNGAAQGAVRVSTSASFTMKSGTFIRDNSCTRTGQSGSFYGLGVYLIKGSSATVEDENGITNNTFTTNTSQDNKVYIVGNTDTPITYNGVDKTQEEQIK